MTTLTAAEIADIRLVTGAVDSGATAVITDAIIQAQFDLATTNAPDTDSILPYTYVYILERLWSVYDAIMYIQRTTDHGDNERITDPRAFIEKRMKYWKEIAGLTSGVMRVGSLSLATDTTQEFIDAQIEALND